MKENIPFVLIVLYKSEPTLRDVFGYSALSDFSNRGGGLFQMKMLPLWHFLGILNEPKYFAAFSLEFLAKQLSCSVEEIQSLVSIP